MDETEPRTFPMVGFYIPALKQLAGGEGGTNRVMNMGAIMRVPNVFVRHVNGRDGGFALLIN